MSLLRAFLRDKRGATAIEYALIVGLIFLAIVVSVTGFSSRTNLMYSKIAGNLT